MTQPDQSRREQISFKGLPRERGYSAKFELRSVGEGRVQLEGYASTTEQPYEMYDWWGDQYFEVIDAGAFDRTLGQDPDVVFLMNHDGAPMARTRAGDLKLAADSTGLHVDATLNLKRTDVQNMVAAIEDGIITEMSFAFMIERQQWSPDYSELRILEVSLQRGDVSAVTFGANPATSIGMARSFRSLSGVKLARAAHALRSGEADSAAIELAARMLDSYALEREPNLPKMQADIKPEAKPVDPSYLRALELNKQVNDERARMRELYGI